jgi:hypothetical protein
MWYNKLLLIVVKKRILKEVYYKFSIVAETRVQNSFLYNAVAPRICTLGLNIFEFWL